MASTLELNTRFNLLLHTVYTCTPKVDECFASVTARAPTLEFYRKVESVLRITCIHACSGWKLRKSHRHGTDVGLKHEVELPRRRQCTRRARSRGGNQRQLFRGDTRQVLQRHGLEGALRVSYIRSTHPRRRHIYIYIHTQPVV